MSERAPYVIILIVIAAIVILRLLRKKSDKESVAKSGKKWIRQFRELIIANLIIILPSFLMMDLLTGGFRPANTAGDAIAYSVIIAPFLLAIYSMTCVNTWMMARYIVKKNPSGLNYMMSLVVFAPSTFMMLLCTFTIVIPIILALAGIHVK